MGLLDQFSKQPLVQQYVKDSTFDLQMRTKAEQDPVVAAASIIARATWLEQMKKLEDLAGRPLPKGSGAQAKQAAVELFKQVGNREWVNFVSCILKLPMKPWASSSVKKTWNPNWGESSCAQSSLDP